MIASLQIENLTNFQFCQFSILVTCQFSIAIFNFGNFQFWQPSVLVPFNFKTFSFYNFQFRLFSSKIFEWVPRTTTYRLYGSCDQKQGSIILASLQLVSREHFLGKVLKSFGDFYQVSEKFTTHSCLHVSM